MSTSPTLPYEIIIGLEVHVQLLTDSKLFCGCSTQFGLPPNSATCPVCIGMPGVLPVMNRKAFQLALQAATALECTLANFTKWDRKNYYYPDLPKNYQVSQYDLPFSKDGKVELETAEGKRVIRIERIHLEEDAGKMMHDESGGGSDSLVDLNRAGTPLLEIVSKPDLRSPEEARMYLEELRLLLRELKISDCEMQEGSLRVDVNVNVKVPKGDTKVATPIVEIKNVNSFSMVQRAAAYEANRQYEEFLENGITINTPGAVKTTAAWIDEIGQTNITRRKEDASDYRYFPEPDLVPILVTDEEKAAVKAGLVELPAAKRNRFQTTMGLTAQEAKTLLGQGYGFCDYFEAVAKTSGDAKASCNWCTNGVMAAMNEQKLSSIESFSLKPDRIAELIAGVKKYQVNMQKAREVFADLLASGEPVEAIIKKRGLDVNFSEEQLRDLAKASLIKNPKAVADLAAGKGKAMDALVGMVMKETKGKAPADLIRQIMQDEIAKMPV